MHFTIKTNNTFWACACAHALLTSQTQFKKFNPKITFSFEHTGSLLIKVLQKAYGRTKVMMDDDFALEEPTEAQLQWLDSFEKRRLDLEVEQLYGVIFTDEDNIKTQELDYAEAARAFLLSRHRVLSKAGYAYPKSTSEIVPIHAIASDSEHEAAAYKFLEGYEVENPIVVIGNELEIVENYSSSLVLAALPIDNPAIPVLRSRYKLGNVKDTPPILSLIKPQDDISHRNSLVWSVRLLIDADLAEEQALGCGKAWRKRADSNHDFVTYQKMVAEKLAPV